MCLLQAGCHRPSHEAILCAAAHEFNVNTMPSNVLERPPHALGLRSLVSLMISLSIPGLLRHPCPAWWQIEQTPAAGIPMLTPKGALSSQPRTLSKHPACVFVAPICQLEEGQPL